MSGENAGRHTATYSAPSEPGLEYWTHSPFLTSTAWPAASSRVSPFVATRRLPLSTTVYSSNCGV